MFQIKLAEPEAKEILYEEVLKHSERRSRIEETPLRYTFDFCLIDSRQSLFFKIFPI